MRKQLEKSYYRVDASVHIWDRSISREEMFSHRPSMERFAQIRKILRWLGFAVGINQRYQKHYKAIAKYHYLAMKGTLTAELGIGGMHTELKFYQPNRAQHPAGAQYDYTRLANMEYLNRLEFKRAAKKIEAYLERQGFQCSDFPADKAPDSLGWLREKRLSDFDGRWAPTGNHEYIEPMYSYNSTDGDGAIVREGDTKFAYDYDGHLIRGTAYYNLNNMWFLANSRGQCLCNLSCGQLFSWRPGLPRRHKDGKGRLKGELANAITSQDFERAIVLRDLIKRLAAT
jgi:hypothetical protein